jgi:hypothetical protein
MASDLTIYKQHCDPHILIPQHISRRACISATFFLYVYILTYTLNYETLWILLGSLYVSSILHWNAVKYSGAIKTIDTVLANSTILHVTFVDSYRWCPDYQQYWMYVFYIIICGFLTNEYLLYMQVTRFSNKIVYIENKYTGWPLSLLNYTNPNTLERERAYIRNTYTHMFFVHVLPTVISFLFGTLSYHQCNWTCDSDNYSE